MRSLLACLLGICLTLSPVFGQTIENYRRAIEQIKIELLISKALLLTLNEQITSLQNDLATANEVQRSLETQIVNLESSSILLEQLQQSLMLTIQDLEDSLHQALEQQRSLEVQVSSLETQLTALLQSLKDSEIELLENETTHIEQIKGLSVGYERRILIQKVMIIALIAVLIEETVRHLLQSKN